MIRFFVFLLLIITSIGFLNGQCAFPPCFSEDCGNLNVGFRPIGGPLFCEGTEITMENTSQPGFDYFVIDWKDGTIDTVYDYSSITHTYQIADSLLCETPSIIPFTVCFKGQKDCPEGNSCQSGSYDFGIRKRPKARFQFPPQICKDTSIQFENVSCNSSVFAWTFHDGTTSDVKNPSFTYTIPGTYSITLVASNPCSSDTITQSIQVVDLPSADFTWSIDSAYSSPCAPVQINFKNLANQWTSTVWDITPKDSTKWMFTDTLMTVRTKDIKVLFKTPGVYTVKLTGSNACDTVVETKVITIYENPTFVIDTPGLFCFNATVSSQSLNFAFSGTVDSIRWNFVNGSIPTHFGFTFPPVYFEVSGSVTMLLYSPCGNRTITIPINIYEGIINFNAPKTTFCRKDGPYTFTADPGGGTWSGPGIQNPQIGLFNPLNLNEGNYKIVYSATVNGCSFSDTIDIQVTWEPVVTLTAPDTFCYQAVVTPQTIGFQASGTILQYLWTFENGSIPSFSGVPFPAVTFTRNGSITLQAIGPCGDTTVTVPILVADTSIVFGPYPDTICRNVGPTQLLFEPVGGAWSGQGIVDPAQGIFDPALLNEGNYKLTYTYFINDCIFKDSISIAVVWDPRINITEPEPFCYEGEITPASLNFTYAGNITQMNWTFENGSIPAFNGPNFPPVRFLENGSVTFFATGPCGDTTIIFPIEVIDTAVVLGNIPDTACRNAGVVPLEVTPGGGVWQGQGVSGFNFDPLSLDEGVYNLVYLLDLGGCSFSDSTEIEVVWEPTITITPPASFCYEAEISPASLNFTYAGNITQMNWTFDNGSISTFDGPNFPAVQFVRSGSVTFFATGPCGDTTIIFPIEVIDTAVVLGNIPDTACRNAGVVPLEVTPGGGVWQGQGVSGFNFDPSSLDEGVYKLVYLLDLGGCSFSDSTEIEVVWEPIVSLMHPSTFCFEAKITPEVLQFQHQGDIQIFRWTFINGSQSEYIGEDFPEVTFLQSGSITLFASGLCGDTTVVITIDVISDSIVFEPYPDSICSNSPPLELRATPGGGRWFGNGIIDEVNGIFDPYQVNRGETHLLTYRLEIDACELIDSLPIYVIPIDTARLTIPDVCIDAGLVTLEANPGGGQWSGPGIQDPVGGIFDPVVSGGGVFELIYTFTDNNSCAVDVRDSIRVDVPPVLDLNRNIVTCIGDTNEEIPLLVNLNITPNVGLSTWSGPGIVDWMGLFNSQAGAGLGAGIYTIYVTHIFNGCTVRDSVEIELLEEPILTLNTLDTVICKETGFFSLIASPSGGIWTGPWIDTQTGVIDLSLADGGTYTYTYKKEDGANCGVEGNVQVQIIDLLSALNVGEMESICEGDPTFQLRQAFPLNGTWSGTGILDPGGLIDLNALVADSTYMFEYCIEGGLNDLCRACKSRPFIKYSNPVIGVSFNDPSCIGANIAAVSNVQNGNLVSWDFGDGNGSTLDNPDHSYVNEGTYTIIVLAENIHACRDTLTEDILIVAPPQASFTFEADSGCSPLLLEVENLSDGYELSYYWLVNGDTIRGFQPENYYLTAVLTDTVYKVTLVSENICGIDSMSELIKVLPQPKSDFGFEFLSGCSPMEVEFSNASYGNPTMYLWDLGNGITSSQVNPGRQIYFALNDTITDYFITLITENECGIDTLTRPISIIPPDVVAFIELDTAARCQPAILTPASFSSPHAQIYWTILFDNDTIAGSSDRFPSFPLEKAGLYTIILKASNCGSDFDTAFFEVLPGPDIRFNHDEVVCEGGHVIFLNESQDAASPIWEFGDGNGSNAFSPSHNYAATGIFNVSLQMTNLINGCPGRKISVVRVTSNPVAEFSLDDIAGCQPLVISPSNNSSGSSALTYEWYFGLTKELVKSENPTYIFPNPGKYPIRLLVKDMYGCRSDTASSEIEVFVTPVADFEYQVNPDDYLIGEVQFTNTTLLGERYLWLFGDGQSSGEVSPFHEYDINGPLNVTLIASNDNFGLASCHDTIIKPIYPERITTFFAPTAMAPEYGPGEVRYFVPKGLGIRDLEVTIYSPYGEQVWFTDKVENGSPAEYWDGYYRGKLVPQGAYLWIAKITYVNGVSELEKGTVTVLR